eukprot:GHVS01082258.1.p1 GENE.GHVS01082258.1~~GHVS01082258.1.p1  ORF type:complete len:561 (-),score=59.08 GHVS01082258.1:229-1860(-)
MHPSIVFVFFLPLFSLFVRTSGNKFAHVILAVPEDDVCCDQILGMPPRRVLMKNTAGLEDLNNNMFALLPLLGNTIASNGLKESDKFFALKTTVDVISDRTFYIGSKTTWYLTPKLETVHFARCDKEGCTIGEVPLETVVTSLQEVEHQGKDGIAQFALMFRTWLEVQSKDVSVQLTGDSSLTASYAQDPFDTLSMENATKAVKFEVELRQASFVKAEKELFTTLNLLQFNYNNVDERLTLLQYCMNRYEHLHAIDVDTALNSRALRRSSVSCNQEQHDEAECEKDRTLLAHYVHMSSHDLQMMETTLGKEAVYKLIARGVFDANQSDVYEHCQRAQRYQLQKLAWMLGPLKYAEDTLSKEAQRKLLRKGQEVAVGAERITFMSSWQTKVACRSYMASLNEKINGRTTDVAWLDKMIERLETSRSYNEGSFQLVSQWEYEFRAALKNRAARGGGLVIIAVNKDEIEWMKRVVRRSVDGLMLTVVNTANEALNKFKDRADSILADFKNAKDKIEQTGHVIRYLTVSTKPCMCGTCIIYIYIYVE